MNKIKKIICVFVLLQCVFLQCILLTACNVNKSENTLSAENFETVMQENGYSIYYCDEELSNKSSTKSIGIEAYYSDKISFSFYEFDNRFYARQYMKSIKQSMKELYNIKPEKTGLSSGTYEFLDKDFYYVIFKEDNVIIYGSSAPEYSDEIDTMLASLGIA